MGTNTPDLCKMAAKGSCKEMFPTRSNLSHPLVIIFSFTRLRGVRRCAIYGVRRAEFYFRGLNSIVDVIVVVLLFRLAVFFRCPVHKSCW